MKSTTFACFCTAPDSTCADGLHYILHISVNRRSQRYGVLTAFVRVRRAISSRPCAASGPRASPQLSQTSDISMPLARPSHRRRHSKPASAALEKQQRRRDWKARGAWRSHIASRKRIRSCSTLTRTKYLPSSLAAQLNDLFLSTSAKSRVCRFSDRLVKRVVRLPRGLARKRFICALKNHPICVVNIWTLCC